MSQEPSEQDLIEAYRRTVKPLYAYVSRRVGGDVSLAEDLVQDTWMRALGSWPAKGIPDDPLAWLVRVARNTLVSHFRHRRPQLLEPALLDLLESQPSAASEDPGAASVVNWGLARLRRAHAELLEDFYFAGKSVRDIARDRSMSERAVEGRLRRAREKLKKRIEKMLPRGATRHRAADGGPELSGAHEPRQEFVNDLELVLRADLRRRSLAAGTGSWLPQSRIAAALTIAAVAIVSMAVGGGVVATAYEARLNEQRDLLLDTFEQRAAVAKQRVALAMRQLRDVQDKRLGRHRTAGSGARDAVQGHRGGGGGEIG